MKRNKVKGFTLVELIIVMATFSIIMFGALQLMEPTNRLYTRGYQAEDLSASQKNIKNYLESNLRYARYMTVSDAPFYVPTMADSQIYPQMAAKVTHFANRHYNGKVTKDGAHATGTIYVIQIDNSRGGKVSSWEYSFTAGDINPENMDNVEMANPTTVTGASTVTLVNSREWAINKASYDNCKYLFSLGAVTKSATLVGSDTMYVPAADATYYSKFSESSMGIFGPQNFTLTISAYDADEMKTVTSGSTTTKYYADMFTTTATTALTNCDRQEKYFHYNWVDKSTDGITPDWQHQKAADNATEILDYSADPTGFRLLSPFENEITDPSKFVSPDYITLIYSYPSGDLT